MAVNDVFNSLTFGEINSLDYGIYVSGPGVYDAPTRDIEFVSVPGRDGAIEVDKGHWNNIEVRYTAGTFGDDKDDFAEKIKKFRNAIVSQIGYQRLTDTYNPGEYRLGIYASGLSVDPVAKNAAGEFELVFNCKPQRYLLSGENVIQVSNRQTLENPTLYPSSPLIHINDGYGHIGLNESSIEIYNETYGSLSFFENANITKNPTQVKNDSFIDNINNGDKITIEGTTWGVRVQLSNATFGYNDNNPQLITADEGVEISYISKPYTNTRVTIDGQTVIRPTYHNYMEIAVRLPTSEFNVKTSKTYTYTVNIPVLTKDAGKSGLVACTFITEYNYFYESITDYLRQWVNFRFGINTTKEDDTFDIKTTFTPSVSYTGTGIIESTKPIVGELYIDTAQGEAYKIKKGEYIDLNRYVSFGSDLPVLISGKNTITYDNTISDVEITPRWWEL